jgi:hypothetical protein
MAPISVAEAKERARKVMCKKSLTNSKKDVARKMLIQTEIQIAKQYAKVHQKLKARGNEVEGEREKDIERGRE